MPIRPVVKQAFRSLLKVLDGRNSMRMAAGQHDDLAAALGRHRVREGVGAALPLDLEEDMNVFGNHVGHARDEVTSGLKGLRRTMPGSKDRKMLTKKTRDAFSEPSIETEINERGGYKFFPPDNWELDSRTMALLPRFFKAFEKGGRTLTDREKNVIARALNKYSVSQWGAGMDFNTAMLKIKRSRE